MTTAVKGLLFDVYGTLFDVHSVITRCERLYPGKGGALSHLWRGKQLEYSWLRSLMGRYADFSAVTADALGFACASLKLALNEENKRALMDAYAHLHPYAEVEDSLKRLQHLPLAVFSNGAPAMLNALLANSGLAKYFRHVISVDEVRIFKPSPTVYELGRARLGLSASETALVSSNAWDVCGALAFGLQAFWVNRAGAPMDALGFTPTAAPTDLAELADRLAVWQ